MIWRYGIYCFNDALYCSGNYAKSDMEDFIIRYKIGSTRLACNHFINLVIL